MSVINSPIGIHLLTNCSIRNNQYLQFIDDCAKAGITHVQLRQKNWSFPDLLAFGQDLKSILSKYQLPLIINDNLKLAAELDAEGIHLGQSDSKVADARDILGPNKIIGLSIESIEELEQANQLNSINYVAASAVFASKTKHNLKKIWGIDGLRQFCTLSKHPVIAIGGINNTNIPSLLTTGINGIAIISAIHEATAPKEYIYQLKTLLSGTKHESL